jgi:hypothetical protein
LHLLASARFKANHRIGPRHRTQRFEPNLQYPKTASIAQPRNLSVQDSGRYPVRLRGFNTLPKSSSCLPLRTTIGAAGSPAFTYFLIVFTANPVSTEIWRRLPPRFLSTEISMYSSFVIISGSLSVSSPNV